MKKVLVVAGALVVLVVLGLVIGGCTAAEATPDSIVRGGLAYDKWWKAVPNTAEPTGNQPLWALQSSNERSGSTTYRCKECHGWDYQGKDGAYSDSSHTTGFDGILNAASKSSSDLRKALNGKANASHDFSALGDDAIDDLVNFIQSGTVDNHQYIDYPSKQATGGNAAKGKTLYESTCVTCHGVDGKLLDFGDGDGVGTAANGNPWETLHKIRYGHPGTDMPSGVLKGWSTQDAVDVLAYSQTLPE